jgi:hypothetical protein
MSTTMLVYDIATQLILLVNSNLRAAPDGIATSWITLVPFGYAATLFADIEVSNFLVYCSDKILMSSSVSS